MEKQGDGTRQKAYSLEKFLDDCKNHKGKVQIDSDAKDEAGDTMSIGDRIRLYGEKK